MGAAHDYATVAYRAGTGAQLWARRYNGTNLGDDEAHSLTVAPGGHAVYVTGGSLGTNGRFDVATVAYKASTGSRLWVARYNDPGNGNVGGWVVKAGPTGRTAYVTADYAPLGNAKSATIAYNAASGAVRWITVNDSLGSASPQGMALAPAGSAIYVTGVGAGPGHDLEYLTAGYQG